MAFRKGLVWGWLRLEKGQKETEGLDTIITRFLRRISNANIGLKYDFVKLPTKLKYKIP